jgi:hypothetical protein
MLRDQEAEALYEELIDLLADAGWGWVVGQVLDEIRLGKMEAKRVRVSEISLSDEYLVVSRTPEKPRAKSEIFTHTVPYTPNERLALLVKAMERSTIELFDIYVATTEFTERRRQQSEAGLHHPLSIEFRSEDESQGRQISSGAQGPFGEKVQLLRALLVELNEAIS